jgi:hypothetical protein
MDTLVAPRTANFKLVCLLIVCCCAIAHAGPTSQPSAADSSTPLNEQTEPQNETPLRLTVGDWFSPEYHGLSNTRGNTVMFRAYVPWRIFSVEQLSRLSIPVVTSSAGKITDGLIDDTPEGPAGLGDIELYDVALLNSHYGQFSIGPVFTFPTGTESGVGKGKWTVGPAIGFDVKHGDWKIGFFSEGFFSFAGESDQPSVEKIKVQPIISYSLPHGWSVGTSDMQFTYDWIKGRSTDLPLGFEIGKNFKVYSQKMKISGQTEYNFASTAGTSAWTFRFTLEYLPPM